MSQETGAKTGHDVTVRRLVPASPEQVFSFWTDAEHLKKWWGPPGVTCINAEVDLRVGGRYRIANLIPDGSIISIHGVFELIDRPTKLVYTWLIGDAGPEERVTVTFLAVPGGTEVVVFHENAPTEATMQSHQRGWVGCLDGLEEYARL